MIISVAVADDYLFGACKGYSDIAFEMYKYGLLEDMSGLYSETWDIPVYDVEKFLLHGTGDQWFSDGFKAYQELKRIGERK
jgi:hypothetical protein